MNSIRGMFAHAAVTPLSLEYLLVQLPTTQHQLNPSFCTQLCKEDKRRDLDRTEKGLLELWASYYRLFGKRRNVCLHTRLQSRASDGDAHRKWQVARRAFHM